MLVANYETKKDLKAAVGQGLRYTETSLFGQEYSHFMDGVAVVGPSAGCRKWYAQVWVKDGIITKVK